MCELVPTRYLKCGCKKNRIHCKKPGCKIKPVYKGNKGRRDAFCDDCQEEGRDKSNESSKSEAPRKVDEKTQSAADKMRKATIEDRGSTVKSSSKPTSQRKSTKSTQSKNSGSRKPHDRHEGAHESSRPSGRPSSYRSDRNAQDHRAPSQSSSHYNDRRAQHPSPSHDYDRRSADQSSSQDDKRSAPGQALRYNNYRQSSRDRSESPNHSRGRDRKPVINPTRFDSGFSELSLVEDGTSTADSGYVGGHFDNDSRNTYHNDYRNDCDDDYDDEFEAAENENAGYASSSEDEV